MTVPQLKLMQEALQARGLYKGSIDGIWGPKSQAAFVAYIDSLEPIGDYVVDSRSADNIKTLHPKVRPIAVEFITKLNAKPLGDLVFRITSATRTYEEQDDLYEQGRTKPGDIVTDARGGYSNHNFGLAFDSTLFRGKKPIYESSLYQHIGTVAHEMGLRWGGDWPKPDEPHVEVVPDWAEGLSESKLIAGLRERHDSGQDVFAV